MIRDELKSKSIAALKAGDKGTRTALSGVLSRFLEVEKSGDFDGWTDEAERALISKYCKSLQSSLGDLGDSPLADGYRAEIALLEPYLPQMLDEAATRALVEPLLDQTGGRLGPLIGRVMKTHKGKVDPGLVRAIALEAGLK